MREMNIKTLVLGMVQTNCYIIHNSKSKEAIIVDPGSSATQIINYIKEEGLICKGILLTHGHFDHIMAADEVKEALSVNIYANEHEDELLQDPILNESARFIQGTSLKADILLKDGQEIELAGFQIRVIHTPGHTIGGSCYLIRSENEEEDQVLISGDTLFYEEIGRADLATGNYSQLLDSIRSKLLPLSDDVIVYPGHDKPSTIGHERIYNPYLKDGMNQI